MDIRASVCPILLLVALILLACGAAFHCEEVSPDDPNDVTTLHASKFALNRAIAAGRLFRDTFGALRLRSSDFCPT